MFILFHISQVLPVDPVQVIEAGDASRLQLAHGVQGKLGVINGMVEALDIGPNMVWCASDQL